jgi:transposase-like protein
LPPEGQEDGMKRKRHTPEQIVKHLRDAARMLGEGKTVTQVCKRIGVTEVTYYRWKKEYDGATRDSIKRLKELGKENAQLKRLLADHVLGLRVLKDIAEGNF